MSISSGNGEFSFSHIVSCQIEFNNSVKGGAIAINNFNSAIISDNNFTQNTCSHASAETSGGAIYSALNDTLTINNNIFIRNVAFIESAQSEILSYGGSLSVINNKKLSVDGNEFYFSNAKSGGALYINNSNADISSQVFNQNNLFYQNSGIYGGALNAVMNNRDSIISTENLFLNNTAKYSGGAIDLRNLNKFNSIRNIFRNNSNEGENTNETTGGSAIYSLNVSQVNLFNTVFDVNKYLGSTELQRKPTIWMSNHDNAYIENCTFLKQIPNDRPIIHKQGNTDPVYIKNSIFTRNLNPETPIINENAAIEYSYIEGLVTEVIDTSFCFDFPESQFMPGSYILNDNDLDFIDTGNPAEIYNDSIHYPIGKGEDLCDLGVSGGRFNLWDEGELNVPGSNDYSRVIKVERYNGSCNWYRIYFVLNTGDDFNDYKWYVDDSIFSTGGTNELIKYIADNKLVPVTGIAKNDVSGLVIIGDNTINSFKEITSSGNKIMYAGSEYQCGNVITINDTCPSTITNVSFSILELKMPFFATYDYNWDFSNLVGITNYSVNDSGYNYISFNMELSQDSTRERFITLLYHGSDTECNITFDIVCQISFNFPNLNENIRVTEIQPAGTILDPQNIYLELVLNTSPYYCNDELIYKLPGGTINPALGIISLTKLPEEIPIEIASMEYTGTSIKFYPDPQAFNKGDYRVVINDLCNSCGFYYNNAFNITIEFLGLDYLELKGINIWPNPAIDKIYIESQNQLVQLNFDIYNSLGILFGKGIIIPDQRYELDVSHFPKGMYLIKFNYNGSREWNFKKIIVE
jgi:predicted outer membrane repeat protein